MNTQNPIFVVALTRHRIFGHMLYPFFTEQVAGEPFLRVLRRVKLFDLNDAERRLTAEESRIVKMAERYSDEKIHHKFCQGKPASELITLFKKEEVRQKVLDYIESIMAEMLRLLGDATIPVYQKREKYTNLYEEDLIQLQFSDTRAVFNFHRLPYETRYFLSLRCGKEHFSLLHKQVEVLVKEPCYIYYQNRIYYFDQISATKLIPFREKEYISIPAKMEQKYYESFILSALKNQEVIHSGFEIRETQPEKRAMLSLQRDLQDFPLFVLDFCYNEVRIRFDSEEHKMVTLKREGDQFVFERLSRDLAWEQSLIGKLQEWGLSGDGGNLRVETDTEPGPDTLFYRSIQWLSQHGMDLADFGIAVSQEGLSGKYYLGRHDLSILTSSEMDWFDLEMTVHVGDWVIPFVRLKRLILSGQREYKLPDGTLFVIPESWLAEYGDLLRFARVDSKKLQISPFHFTLLAENAAICASGLREEIEKKRATAMLPRKGPEGMKAELR
ncbi:MAG: hypothetical protein LWW85_15695, partial [Marinilabiliales bacterium]|nr:hypothetical protein [Marinilabiliales bacterium]